MCTIAHFDQQFAQHVCACVLLLAQCAACTSAIKYLWSTTKSTMGNLTGGLSPPLSLFFGHNHGVEHTHCNGHWTFIMTWNQQKSTFADISQNRWRSNSASLPSLLYCISVIGKEMAERKLWRQGGGKRITFTRWSCWAEVGFVCCDVDVGFPWSPIFPTVRFHLGPPQLGGGEPFHIFEMFL